MRSGVPFGRLRPMIAKCRAPRSINQSAVTIQGYSYPAYSLKLRDISGSPASGSGINYYVVRYGLYANRDLWKPHKLLDKGWRSFDEGDSNTPENEFTHTSVS